MKQFVILVIASLFYQTIFAQALGNANYRQNRRNSYYTNNNKASNQQQIEVKVLANVKADVFVAIFCVSQVGKTAEEVNQLMDERIGKAIAKLKPLTDLETYVDMISFVPLYEYEIAKKLFSKSYNEIPAGFELKKNIHVKYTNASALNEIIRSFSTVEIYDLVKVDYFSTSLAKAQSELKQKAKNILREKLNLHQELRCFNLDSIDKKLGEKLQIIYPKDSYQSYTAFSSPALKLKRDDQVKNKGKASSSYYSPVSDEGFDLVVNSIVFEPIIQIIYSLSLQLDDTKEKDSNLERKYILVSPNGDLKTLDTN